MIRIQRLLLLAWLAACEDSPMRPGRGWPKRWPSVSVTRWSMCSSGLVHGSWSSSRSRVSHSGFREVVLQRARQARSPALVAELVDPLTDRELEVLSYLPSR